MSIQKNRTERYYYIKDRLIKYLGGKCVKCGTTTNLEFDHKNREEKEFNIASKITTYPLKVLFNEADKCQLLCYDHHIDKSIEESGKKKASENHGSLSCYSHARCRCKLCKDTWNARCKIWKKKHRNKIVS